HARLPMRSRDAIAKPHPATRYDRPLHVNGLAELMKPPHRRGHKWSALAVDGTPLPVVSFSFLSAKCVAEAAERDAVAEEVAGPASPSDAALRRCADADSKHGYRRKLSCCSQSPSSYWSSGCSEWSAATPWAACCTSCCSWRSSQW